MKLNREVEFFLFIKRTRKATRRREKAWRAHQQKLEYERQTDQRFGKRSRIIGMLAKGYFGDLEQLHGRGGRSELTLKMPKIFSVIEDPVQAIGTTGAFAKTLKTHRIKSVRFDHSAIQKYDLAASGILDV